MTASKTHRCYDCGRPSGAAHQDASCEPCARAAYEREQARVPMDEWAGEDDWTDGGRRGDAGGL